MDDVQEINVDELMARIREHLPNPQRTPVASAATLSSNGLVAAELTSLQSNQEIAHFPLISHRKFLGPLILLAKKALRKLLTPSLERQSTYNAANFHLSSYLWEQVEALQKLNKELLEQIGELRQELAEQHEGRYQELAEQIGGVHEEQTAALQALRGELTAQLLEKSHEQATGLQVLRAQMTEAVARIRQEYTGALQEMRERSSRAERRVRRFIAAFADGPHAEITAVQKSLPPPKAALEGNSGPDFDYFGFEERFRGSEEDIKDRYRAYVDFFKEAQQVLDIGCGRGEFLELLAEAGIKARGVDLDLDMVLYCQEKGLDVLREEAYAYLESLPDDSLDGLFAGHLVEHLDPTRIIELVSLCQRKLRPGGVLLFETPNPVCLTVFARSFYMDFSHIRPIHPEAMKFLFESAGFEHLEVNFSSPVEPSMRIPPLSGIAAEAQVTEEFNRGIERLNELLYGFQDYAVIGRKACQ